MKKAALHNLGCKVNAYETEAMQQMLEEAGYEIVPFSEKADVYVINTCSVTNMADRKSRQMLHRAKKLNPDAAVVAAGCYVQTKENEAKCDEAIDILIGNNQKKELVERLDAFFAGRGEKVEAVVDINHEKQAFEELTLDHAAEHTRAFIKVQDGCNQFCSYCIIPYARGRVRSRNVQNVLEEVKRLAASGYQEVVLTGIHLSSYGIDCGESLLHLIQMVHPAYPFRIAGTENRDGNICRRTGKDGEDLSAFSSVTAERMRCNACPDEPEIYDGRIRKCMQYFTEKLYASGNHSGCYCWISWRDRRRICTDKGIFKTHSFL